MLKSLRRVIQYIFQNFFEHLTAVVVKVSVFGKENIPDVPGAIIVANHISYLDVPCLGWAFNERTLKMKWVVSKEIYGLWFMKWVYIIWDVIVLNGTIEKIKLALSQNRWVVIFPEGGERMCPPWLREEIRKKRSRRGAAIIALSTGVSVIPVGITGADKVLPMRSFRLNRRHKIVVRIGKPFSYKMVSDNDITDELVNQTKQEIIDRIYSLVENVPSD